jgi:hypothetical protein
MTMHRRADDGRPVDPVAELVRSTAEAEGLTLDPLAREACPHGTDPSCPTCLLEAASRVVDAAGRPRP